MTTLNKNNTDPIDEYAFRIAKIHNYMVAIEEKCEASIIVVKKKIKMDNDNIIIPTIKDYQHLIKYNYNLSQLKQIAKKYKLKMSGNKNELIKRIYSYLYFSSFIIKIQKNFRGMLVKKYKSLHGPAAINRNLCTNTDDFITMEPIKEINFHQFISYKDNDGFIYGFDIGSLYNLYLKSKNLEKILNPYNRNVFPEFILKTIKAIVRLSKILKIVLNLQFEDDTKNISNEKAIELRALTLFQNIDALGNYSNPQWFLSLSRPQLIKLLRELCDIWNYRAQLNNETKRKICPPNGDPFRNLSMPYVHTEENLSNVKKHILEILEKLVNSGVDNDSKALGAYYVLGSLTIINESAATSLPWLFQSFVYF